MRLLPKNSSSRLRVFPTDTTTSYSVGSTPQSTTGHLSFPQASSPLCSLFWKASLPQRSTSSLTRLLTRDLTPQASTSNKLLPRLPQEARALSKSCLRSRSKDGNTQVFKTTAGPTFALHMWLQSTKLLACSLPITSTALSSHPRMFTPWLSLTLTSRSQQIVNRWIPISPTANSLASTE